MSIALLSAKSAQRILHCLQQSSCHMCAEEAVIDEGVLDIARYYNASFMLTIQEICHRCIRSCLVSVSAHSHDHTGSDGIHSHSMAYASNMLA